MKISLKQLCCAVGAGAVMMGCASGDKKEVTLDFEKFTLGNGMNVVLQPDHSDPVVAVAIQYHVGSAREKTGKTGFAHFFEHMLFQRSENLPRNAFFEKISGLGGEFNGGTGNDGTIYHEIVPKDALEKVLWMESDRMGYFINTVTQRGLEREIDVVSNEKRQMYDNRPYGHLMPVIARYLYPAGHPYSWTVIGELADLRSATLDDVKEFYHTYYVPNNATLVISGDFEPEKARTMVEKYFGEIKRGADVPKMDPMPATLAEDVKVVHEDNYATMPMLTLVWPAVENYHPDDCAIDLMTSLLAEGKDSPLYRVIVEERKLAPEVSMFYYPQELAGSVMLMIPAYEGVNLNDVYAAVGEAFERFDNTGADAETLESLKALHEVSTYDRLSGVYERAQSMANSDVFTGEPDRALTELKRTQAVTTGDVRRVFDRYIKDKHLVAASFVPKGQPGLALEGSKPAVVVEESVDEQQMNSEGGEIVDEDDYERTPSAIDRAQEPALDGGMPLLKTPEIWSSEQPNGLMVYGITNNEMPYVQFALVMKGGMLYDDPQKVGVANLYASLLLEGTKDKTPAQLQKAFRRLGANVQCYAAAEYIAIEGSCLSRNLPAVMKLIDEVLTEPRFDADQFVLAKQQTLTDIRQQQVRPTAIAAVAAQKLLYGPGNILSNRVSGDEASVEQITLDDLRAYHDRYISPSASAIHFAGMLTEPEAVSAIRPLVHNWPDKEVPELTPGEEQTLIDPRDRIFFVDYPGAQQSYVMAARRAMPVGSPDYYPARIVNYKLGESTEGRLFNELRLKRGYTYGAYSRLNSGRFKDMFVAAGNMQSSVTKESVDVLRDILANYGATYTQEDLDATRTALIRSNAGAFETPKALVGMLAGITEYDLPADYVKQREDVLRELPLGEAKRVIGDYLGENEMLYIVVGDAKSQLPRLQGAGLGEPVVLDRKGDRMK
ncbi:MAG: insulinase family protein [Rikenellaceae bacterium]|nr:insulinase family protein [Rikenellaceae bacterium]